MNWFSHETSFMTAKRYGLMDRGVDRNEYYRRLIQQLDIRYREERSWYEQLQVEWIWEKGQRPFYNVWPSIMDGLAKLKLENLECETIKPLIERLPGIVNLRYARGNELNIGVHKLRSVLVCRKTEIEGYGKGLHLFCDAGQVNDQGGGVTVPVYWTACLSLEEGTVEYQFEECGKISSSSLMADELEIVHAAARTYCSIAIMRSDPDLVEEVLLKRDENSSGDRAELISRARREGIIGWHIGRNVQVSPHYRKAHVGLRWTGEGRRIPRVVAIKGSVIHKRLIQEVPTGFADANQEERATGVDDE